MHFIFATNVRILLKFYFFILFFVNCIHFTPERVTVAVVQNCKCTLLLVYELTFRTKGRDVGAQEHFTLRASALFSPFFGVFFLKLVTTDSVGLVVFKLTD